MPPRRAQGALEDEVMDYMWALETPASPSEIHAAIAPALAYTTMSTVISRLWEKGRLSREASGRTFLYSAARSEARHRADVMRANLSHATDREAVLSSFVEALEPDDIDVLRSLLSEEP